MIRACVHRARKIYWQNWNRQTRPYDGIMELLDALEGRTGAQGRIIQQNPMILPFVMWRLISPARHF